MPRSPRGEETNAASRPSPSAETTVRDVLQRTATPAPLPRPIGLLSIFNSIPVRLYIQRAVFDFDITLVEAHFHRIRGRRVPTTKSCCRGTARTDLVLALGEPEGQFLRFIVTAVVALYHRFGGR